MEIPKGAHMQNQKGLSSKDRNPKFWKEAGLGVGLAMATSLSGCGGEKGGNEKQNHISEKVQEETVQKEIVGKEVSAEDTFHLRNLPKGGGEGPYHSFTIGDKTFYTWQRSMGMGADNLGKSNLVVAWEDGYEILERQEADENLNAKNGGSYHFDGKTIYFTEGGEIRIVE